MENALKNYNIALNYNEDIPELYNNIGLLYHNNEKYKIAGKTGTAQVISNQTIQELGITKLTRATTHHSLFVGFGPVHDPQYACSIIASNAGSGARVAAPIGRDILHYTMKKLMK